MELIDCQVVCAGVEVKLCLAISAKDYEMLSPEKARAITIGIAQLLASLEWKKGATRGDKAANA